MGHVCNPLSIITGEICPHYRICKKSCLLARERAQKNPIFVSRPEVCLSPPLRKGELSALVIGSGPAGLAAAWELRKFGFEVTVIERQERFGGALWLIPDMRLDKKHIEKVVQDLKDAGVVFKSNTNGKIQDRFDYIVFATGTWNSRQLGIEGEEFTINALDYLILSAIGSSSVVVIGGGNVAVDCAVEAVRRGGNATVCYRKTEQFLKAEPYEIAHAKKVGVQFEFEMVPKKITSDGVQFERKFVPCDQVVVAVGQYADLPKGIENYQNVIIVGDAALGATSVLKAVLHAKACVRVSQESLLNSSNPDAQ